MEVLERTHCCFGGGTRITLELDEYRESEDVDFICSDLAGYRELRATVDDRSLGTLLPKLPKDVSLCRTVRTDQYGIRTVFDVDGEPVKFEIILEARIQVTAAHINSLSVPVLDRVSCFAEKWLANADRWNDTSVLSRDAFDLAFMLRAWGKDDALAGAKLAIGAYGDAVIRAACAASQKLLDDGKYRKQCALSLAITESKTLLSGMKQLEKLAKELQ